MIAFFNRPPRLYIFLALGGLALGVVAAGCGFQAASAAPAAPLESTPGPHPQSAIRNPQSAGGVALPALVQPARLADYHVIIERDLFQPVTAYLARRRVRDDGTARSGVDQGPPPSPNGEAHGVRSLPEGPPVAPPTTADSSPASRLTDHEPPGIVLTGFLRMGVVWQALLEDLATERGDLVAVGDEAFGYRLLALDRQRGRVTVERGGQTYVLRLGDVDREDRATGTDPSSSPGQTSQRPLPSAAAQSADRPQPGGLTSAERLQKLMQRFGGDLPPEMIERYREWEQRRYGY